MPDFDGMQTQYNNRDLGLDRGVTVAGSGMRAVPG